MTTPYLTHIRRANRPVTLFMWARQQRRIQKSLQQKDKSQ